MWPALRAAPIRSVTAIDSNSDYLVKARVMRNLSAMASGCLLVAAFGLCDDERAKGENVQAVGSAAKVWRPRGREQANAWTPLNVIMLGTEAERRRAMLDRIEAEVEKRHSTIDLVRLGRVLVAMDRISRERFVDADDKSAAYVPTSLDIGFGQTISDAYIVAIMTVAAKLTPDSNVLDIGTGSGYQAALLSELSRQITSVEIVPQLTKRARLRLKRLGYANVDVRQGDGSEGWASRAPFDAIVVAAGATSVPPALVNQLKTGGRLIIPIGPTAPDEELLVVTKLSKSLDECSLGPATFVPMTGQIRTLNATNTATAARSKVRMCFDVPVT